MVTHNSKRRLVFNLKHVNSFHVKRACRFGSLSSLRRIMREGDWMWSIDLSDAYHLVGVHSDDQKYFTFALETDRGVEYFSTSALNFGWCRSPQIMADAPCGFAPWTRRRPVPVGRGGRSTILKIGARPCHDARLG